MHLRLCIKEGVGAAGQPLPEKPQRSRESGVVRFDGVVRERHTTANGSTYVYIVLGTSGGAADEVEDPASVVDAEFIFPPGLCLSSCFPVEFLSQKQMH